MKNKKWAAILFVSLVILMVGGYAFYQKQFGVVDWAQGAVLAKLNDEDSAKFRNIRVLGIGEVCGEVNAKNRMGGYVGYQHFYLIGTPHNKEGVEPYIRFSEKPESPCA